MKMGIAERRYRQKEEVKSLILETAWKMILEEGYPALSIRKVADAIEYSVPVIYSHFEGKDAILKEFVQKGYELLVKDLKQAKEQHPNACAQLEAMAMAYWDFAFANKEYYQLMFGLGIPSCESVRQVPEIQEFSELIQSVIRASLAHANRPDADYFLKYHTFWSILHGMISIQMNGAPHSREMGVRILRDAVSGFIFALQQ